jgi:hypothetical protein
MFFTFGLLPILGPVAPMIITVLFLGGMKSGFNYLIDESQFKQVEIQFLEYDPNGCGEPGGLSQGSSTDWSYNGEVSTESMDQKVNFDFLIPVDSICLEVRYGNTWGYLMSETEGGFTFGNASTVKWSNWILAEKIEDQKFSPPSISMLTNGQWEALEPENGKAEAQEALNEQLAYLEAEPETGCIDEGVNQ